MEKIITGTGFDIVSTFTHIWVPANGFSQINALQNKIYEGRVENRMKFSNHLNKKFYKEGCARRQPAPDLELMNKESNGEPES